MGLFSFLSKDTENTTAVQDISQTVLDVVAEEEESEATSGFVSILIRMMKENEEIIVDTEDKAGGFGGADLLVIVVVPAVAMALDYLLTKFDVESVGVLRKQLQAMPNPQDSIKITADDIREAVNRTRSPIGKRNIKKIAEAVNKAVSAYLLK